MVSTLQGIIFVLAPVIPWLIKLPTHRKRMVRTLNRSMGEIADVMLERSRKAGEKDLGKSIIGLLCASLFLFLRLGTELSDATDSKSGGQQRSNHSGRDHGAGESFGSCTAMHAAC